MDFFKEFTEKEEWERGLSDEGMTLDELVGLASDGLGRCPDRCFSRSVCGDDACACVRSVFPTPEHYETYLKARCFFLEHLAKATFVQFLSVVSKGQ
jgi:hypothetical protein